jgi:hypothetical protein
LAVVNLVEKALLKGAWPAIARMVPKAIVRVLDEVIAYFETLKPADMRRTINNVIDGRKKARALRYRDEAPE